MKLKQFKKVSCFAILFLALLFSSCTNFFDKEACCEKYVEDRTLFLDSLFTELFPEKFNYDSITSIHTVDTCHNCYKHSLEEDNFRYHPNNLNDTLLTRLVWSSSNVEDNYSTKYHSKYYKRPKSELIPRFKVFMYYSPTSVCNTLTERWEFYNGKQYVYVLGDWIDDTYADEFVVFDYIIKEDQLISKYSNSGLIDYLSYTLDLENEEDINEENIKRVKDYGVLSFDTLMNWKENYLENVSMDCAK